uniref:Uncharacterized protein n=1 Tax=Latimeria chalumnae TaxID=7897 RepID=H3AKK4_LATCH
MYNGSYPNCPFISYYDNEYDIQKRDHRAKRKIEELREAGMLEIPLPVRKSHRKTQKQAWHFKKKKKVAEKQQEEKEVYKKPKKKKKKTSKTCVKQCKGRKLKTQGIKNLEVEKDFPREMRVHPSNDNSYPERKFESPILFSRSRVFEDTVHPAKKRRKMKHKSKGNDGPEDDNLFSIKQRKPKRRDWLPSVL